MTTTRQVLVSPQIQDISTGDSALDTKLNEWLRKNQINVFSRVSYLLKYAPDHEITSAEVSAGVTPTNYQYKPSPSIEFERYGGVIGSGNGATNDAALTDALSVLSTNGGEIVLGKGEYYFDSQIDLSSRTSIKIRGAGNSSGGLTPGTQIVYTGTTAPFISISGSLGIEFENLSFRFSDTGFTGALIGGGNDGSNDCFRCCVRRCLFGNSIGTGCVHLDLDETIEFVAEQCHFIYGNPSVKGQASAGGSYSNVIMFRDCTWTTARSTPVEWGGDSWTFDGCTFEGKLDGTAGAFDYGSPSSHGMAFRGCWFGDVTVSGGTWIAFKGAGLNVSANQFGGFATSTTAINLTNTQGFVIDGNNFDTFSNVLNFGDSGSKAGSFRYNDMLSCTTPISGTPPGDVQFDFNPNYPMIDAPAAVVHQALSGAGAIDVTHTVTLLTTTSANALSLADGTFAGQEKIIFMVVDGGDGTLTPTHLANFTTITFTAVGNCIHLRWNNGTWQIVSNNGCTIA